MTLDELRRRAADDTNILSGTIVASTTALVRDLIDALIAERASPEPASALAARHGFRPHGRDPLTGGVKRDVPPGTVAGIRFVEHTSPGFESVRHPFAEPARPASAGEAGAVGRLTAERDVARVERDAATATADAAYARGLADGLAQRRVVSQEAAERDVAAMRVRAEAAYDQGLAAGRVLTATQEELARTLAERNEQLHARAEAAERDLRVVTAEREREELRTDLAEVTVRYDARVNERDDWQARAGRAETAATERRDLLRACSAREGKARDQLVDALNANGVLRTELAATRAKALFEAECEASAERSQLYQYGDDASASDAIGRVINRLRAVAKDST